MSQKFSSASSMHGTYSYMVVDVEFYKPPKDFKIAVLLKEELI